ncbi:MAG: branched-chain amino acid ABC transporter permease [Acidimicrobiia bacterium]|nr:branched-chain amino acid ABC transporter permease [Acidimicrobiia bacterium]
MEETTTDADAPKASAAMFTFSEGTSQHRMFQLIGWAFFFVPALVIPYILPNFRVSQFGQVIAFSVALLGMNMVIGYSGLLSIGHIAFMGTGAYLTVILVNDNRWDVWMTLPVVIIANFVFGALLGFPALKIKGLYLALVTLALAYTFPILLKIDEWGIARRTGGDNGKNLAEAVKPPGWARSLLFINGRKPQEQQAIYQYFCLFVLALICFLIVRNIIKSRPGRSMIAIRDNQIGAAVSGVPLNMTKVLTFAISAAVTGVSGSMLAVNLNSVGPTSFDFNYAILTIMGLVLGGVATLHGNWVGALLLVFIQDLTSRVSIPPIIPKGSPLTRAVFGIVLVLVAFFMPGGVVSFATKLKRKFVRVIPQVPKGSSMDTATLSVDSSESGTLSGAAR